MKLELGDDGILRLISLFERSTWRGRDGRGAERGGDLRRTTRGTRTRRTVLCTGQRNKLAGDMYSPVGGIVPGRVAMCSFQRVGTRRPARGGTRAGRGFMNRGYDARS
eukprot:644672_1